MPHAAFSEVEILTRPSGGDDYRSDAALEKFESVIQPGPVYRGRATCILSSAKDYDRIRGMNFLL